MADLTLTVAETVYKSKIRAITTLAQKKGTVKHVQGLLRHSRAATTSDVYMQEIPSTVQSTINSINQELKRTDGANGMHAKSVTQSDTNSSLGGGQRLAANCSL